MSRRPALPFCCSVLVGAAALLLVGCSGGARYFQSNPKEGFTDTGPLAVMPLLNLSRYEQAPEIVMNALVVELLNSRVFAVVDPGLVEEAVLDKRIRLTDRLALETMQELGDELGVKYLLLGSVNEFSFVQDGNQQLPCVSITLRIVACSNGRVLWASTNSRRGDDAEKVFGIGRVETLEQLASATVRQMVDTLKP